MQRIVSLILLAVGFAAVVWAVIGFAAPKAREELAATAPAARSAEADVAALPAEAPLEAVPPPPPQSAPADVPPASGSSPESPKSTVQMEAEAAIDEIMKGASEAATGTFGGAGETSLPAEPARAEQSFEETLKTVPVAHEAPETAEYKRPFEVSLAIDSTGDLTATDALPGDGRVVEGEAKVSDRVQVRLTGASFEIASTSPETQKLSPVTENIWRWTVTPIQAGEHDLVFEVYAIDQKDVTPLRTFRDTVTVNVSGVSRAVAFADRVNPLFVMLGGLGSMLAGAFGIAKFFQRKP